MPDSPANRLAGGVLILLIGGTPIALALEAYGNGAPIAEWLPMLTTGLLGSALLVGFRVTDGEQAYGPFDSTDWVAVTGFGACLLLGLSYLSLGYSSIAASGLVFIGVVGTSLVLYVLQAGLRTVLATF